VTTVLNSDDPTIHLHPCRPASYHQGGRLGPGEECDILVTCHALSDGQHHSVVKLHCPGGHLQCLEAFAAVVTPRVVVSRPKVGEEASTGPPLVSYEDNQKEGHSLGKQVQTSTVMLCSILPDPQ
jgi:hypothetical protein